MTLRVGILGFGGAGQAHYSFFGCVAGCRVAKVFDSRAVGLERAAALAPHVTRRADLDAFWRRIREIYETIYLGASRG